MKKKLTFFSLTAFVLCLSLQLQGFVTYNPLEVDASNSDYVVVAKYIKSVEVKVSKSQTYTIDTFLLEKTLIQNAEGKLTSVNKYDDLFVKKDWKPKSAKIFCMTRLSSRGISIRPIIPDPNFQKHSSYLLVLKSLYPNPSSAGMYAPMHAYQNFPLATKKYVAEFMRKYEKLKNELNSYKKRNARSRSVPPARPARPARPVMTVTSPKTVKGISILGLKVKGADIIKLDRKYLYYNKKCRFCGYVSPKQMSTQFLPSPWTSTFHFDCPKCNRRSKVTMQRYR